MSNINIEKLVADYKMEDTTLPRLIEMAKRYVLTMENSQVRVILHMLAEQTERMEKENKNLRVFVGAGNMSDAVTKVAAEAGSLIQALMDAERFGWFKSDPTNISVVHQEIQDVQDTLKELNICMKSMEAWHEEDMND